MKSNVKFYSLAEFSSSSNEGRKELIGPHLDLEWSARVRPMFRMEFKSENYHQLHRLSRGPERGALLSFYREAPTKRGTFFRLSEAREFKAEVNERAEKSINKEFKTAFDWNVSKQFAFFSISFSFIMFIKPYLTVTHCTFGDLFLLGRHVEEVTFFNGGYILYEGGTF